MLGSRKIKRVPLGFTLVEVLVCIGIILILLGLSLPAIQRARDAGYRATCLSRLAGIGKAIHQYHDTARCLPPGLTDPTLIHPLSKWLTDKSPYVRMLPQLGEAPLFDAVNFDLEMGASANHTVLGVQLKQLTCPSDAATFEPEVYTYAGPLPPLHAASFAFCAGRVPVLLFPVAWPSTPPAWAVSSNDGCFFSLSPIRLQDVTDGLSSTLFAAEQSATLRRKLVPQVGSKHKPSTGWCFDFPNNIEAVLPPVDDQTALTYGANFTPTASSDHPGVVGALFGDGSVRTVSKKIDSWSVDSAGNPVGSSFSLATGHVLPPNGVWQSLFTRAGNEIISEGSW